MSRYSNFNSPLTHKVAQENINKSKGVGTNIKHTHTHTHTYSKIKVYEAYFAHIPQISARKLPNKQKKQKLTHENFFQKAPLQNKKCSTQTRQHIATPKLYKKQRNRISDTWSHKE